jgi:hypothetical protein
MADYCNLKCNLYPLVEVLVLGVLCLWEDVVGDPAFMSKGLPMDF